MTGEGSVPRRARESLIARVAIWFGVIAGFATGAGLVVFARRPLESADENRTVHPLVVEPASSLARRPAAACTPVREMPAFAQPRGLGKLPAGSLRGDDVDRATGLATPSDSGAGGAP